MWREILGFNCLLLTPNIGRNHAEKDAPYLFCDVDYDESNRREEQTRRVSYVKCEYVMNVLFMTVVSTTSWF